MARQVIDALDKKILQLIQSDARIPFLEVARACNVSGAAIHQRIQKLTSLGIIKGSQFIIDPEKIGYETCAYVGLYLKDPEKFDQVVEKLRQIPEVTECYNISGSYDYLLKIHAPNMKTYQEFVLNILGNIDHLGSLESTFVMDELKHDFGLHI